MSDIAGGVGVAGGMISDAVSGAAGIASGDLETWRGATLARSAMPSYKQMVAAAAADGVSLVPGSTYRSSQAQFALRGVNGCRGREMDRSCTGRPRTAVPGSSQHEAGLAVDCQNARTYSSTVHQWLAANASRFGWAGNVPDEPWHWSTGPRAGS